MGWLTGWTRKLHYSEKKSRNLGKPGDRPCGRRSSVVGAPAGTPGSAEARRRVPPPPLHRWLLPRPRSFTPLARAQALEWPHAVSGLPAVGGPGQGSLGSGCPEK